MSRRTAAAAAAVLPLLILLAQLSALGAFSPQAAPPPTPIPPAGSPSPFVSKLRTPADPVPLPRVGAAAAILMDLGTDQVLFRRAPGVARPVASLTKLMTALVVLEAEGSRLDRAVRIHPDAVFERGDYGVGSTLDLRAGEHVSVRGLLAGLLLGSANDAAEALAIEESGSVGAFVEAMNVRAERLGMSSTRFASPHGLDDRGRSSAADLLRLLRAAIEEPVFRRLVARRSTVIRSDAVAPRRIQNRNVMLWLYPGASGVKTGFTVGAGFCLIATARRGDRELASVVLGGGDEVFSDAAAQLDHGFAAYETRTLVEHGERLGSVRVRGGTVPVIAGAELAALVRLREVAAIDRILVTRRGTAFPPPEGSRVGTLRLRLGGVVLGTVPLVVADLAPPEEPRGWWWSRAAGALGGAIWDVVAGLLG